MPWSNQSGGGGPWGGGSNGGNGDGNGPWGGGGNRGNGGGNQPPDLEELFKKGQQQFKNAIPGGNSPMFFGIIALVLVGLYAVKATYQIQADELGVQLVLGVPEEQVSEPGLHWHWWPVESYEIANVRQNQVNIGQTERGGTGKGSGLMLSGDQNIVDMAFSVFYQVSDANAYLFNVADPDEMVRKIAESAMREVVGRRPAQEVFRDDRAGVATDVKLITQETLNLYKTGLTINAVNIEDVAPPGPVADAYDEVQRAEQDEDRFVEEANRYSNKELGQARGEAAQILEDSAAYKNRIVQEATGEAQRFISVYDEYKKAPEVTRKRLFLETMENVLGKSNKVIIEQGSNGQGVVPYLPLPEIDKKKNAGDAQ